MIQLLVGFNNATFTADGVSIGVKKVLQFYINTTKVMMKPRFEVKYILGFKAL
jgi:hypothetical protein